MKILFQVAVVKPPMSQTITVRRSYSVATMKKDMIAVRVEPTATPRQKERRARGVPRERSQPVDEERRQYGAHEGE